MYIFIISKKLPFFKFSAIMLVDTYYKMRSEKNDIKRTWHRTEGDHPVCGRQRSAQTALFGYGADQGCGSNGCEICSDGRSDRAENTRIRADDPLG